MEGKKTQKRLQANTALRQIITDFYAEGHKAKAEGRPVIWIPPMNGMVTEATWLNATPMLSVGVCSLLGAILFTYVVSPVAKTNVALSST